MTKHINPGTDTTINTVVIDDSYRERKPTTKPKQLFIGESTPDQFIDVNLGDWVYLVGDISTPYEVEFVKQFGYALKNAHTSAPAQPRVDWVEEVRLRCYSYTEFYGGERAIRFDELEGVIRQVKEERKECYDSHTSSKPQEKK